ncbi:O-methyltransferase [Microbulbifer variabilis]|uniref:O-methyltransferase n=1 Tax=Microbulbifer variabilis TaxID=266805 RepID=UPI001CFEE097|nr:class I SAM-dependent methyltransferase [Microbulbifer variabilis]
MKNNDADSVRLAELKNYKQLESLLWLSRVMGTKRRLPPLRGWAASPDVLLELHDYITLNRPKIVVEFGSGASTLVIADALRQNGFGKLVSFDHSTYYGENTRRTLERENLDYWVDLRIGALESWSAGHLASDEDSVSWYPEQLLEGLEAIDLVFIDGPPGATCQYARYPAVPAIVDRLSTSAQVWMDDTIRKEERDICEAWAEQFGFDLEYLNYEKGLGRLSRKSAE